MELVVPDELAVESGCSPRERLFGLAVEAGADLLLIDDKTAALAALERANMDRSERLVNSDYGGLHTDPAWDGLRDDPRFEALCRRAAWGKDQWPR